MTDLAADFQVYAEKLAADLPTVNAHHVVQLQSDDGVEVRSSDGCSKHAGTALFSVQ
jgi:hypothetical protein